MTDHPTDPRREVAIARAVSTGRILAASADEYRRRWDADPAATEQLLGSLAAVPSVAAENAAAAEADPALGDLLATLGVRRDT